MKPIKCTVICNTRWGYEMQPKECKSIREALRYAKEMEMPYRIYVGTKLIRKGVVYMLAGIKSEYERAIGLLEEVQRIKSR